MKRTYFKQQIMISIKATKLYKVCETILKKKMMLKMTTCQKAFLQFSFYYDSIGYCMIGALENKRVSIRKMAAERK